MNFDLLIEAYQHRAYRLIMAVGQRIAGLVMTGKSQGEAWNMCTIDLTKAAQVWNYDLYIYYITICI